MICDRDAIKVSRFPSDPRGSDESGDVCGLYGSSWRLHETLKRTISRTRVCYRSPARSDVRGESGVADNPSARRAKYLSTHA